MQHGIARIMRLGAVVALASLVVGCAHEPAPQAKAPSEPLDAKRQPKFVNALPNPFQNVAVPDTTTHPGADYYHLRMVQVRQDLGLVDPDTGQPLLTTVWAYGPAGGKATYPGPTIIARSTLTQNSARPGRPVKVLWENALPEQHLLPVDTTVHCGPDARQQHSHCRPFVRTVVHLHGGHVPDHSDGYPEAWFSPGFKEKGPHWSRQVYDYPNDQEAVMLWYHDHAMGITRLNVYAGLAGLYVIRDDNEDRLQREQLLPAAAYDIPLVIQDRSFKRDGSLHYIADIGEHETRPEAKEAKDPSKDKPLARDDAQGSASPGTRGSAPVPRDPVTGKLSPSIEPETFGDTILVNGKVWPVLEVEPRKYRFRILNGSNARFYRLSLDSTQRFVQIGSDGGLLNAPVTLTHLLLSPAERADVIVDFSDPRLAGKTIVLRNDAKAPFPNGEAVDPGTTGQVMAFRVTRPRSALPEAELPRALRAPITPHEVRTAKPRELLLTEGEDEFGRVKPMLGTAERGPLGWDDPITETPKAGTTEIWRIINTTPDAHPVHLHLVFFQVVDRQKIDAKSFVPGKPETLKRVGPLIAPPPQETGWKDTVIVNPGEALRLIARFDRPGLYVWHCHILEHEDHEMMRPYRVLP
jgi:spore coat protein A